MFCATVVCEIPIYVEVVDFWKVIRVYRSLIDNYGALEIWGAGAVVPTCAMQYTGLTESLGLGHQVF